MSYPPPFLSRHCIDLANYLQSVAFQLYHNRAFLQDEAYALASQDEGRSGSASSSFASEAIRTLLTEVENNRSRVMVVLAGYKDKMKRLLAADPGFPRRFPLMMHLDDYSAPDLALIAEKTAAERFGMTFLPGLCVLFFSPPYDALLCWFSGFLCLSFADKRRRGDRRRDTLAEYIENEYSSEIKDHNGGLAVNLTDAAVGRLATRIVDSGDPTVSTTVLVPAGPLRHLSSVSLPVIDLSLCVSMPSNT